MSLQLRSLTKIYRTKGESVVAVNGVSLSLPEHGFVIILGRSGCGKTTLLNLLGKMDMPTGGMALYNGRSIYSMPEYNQKVGFVFQEIHLFPFMSAKRNIELAQDYAGVHARPAEDYLRLVGMEEFAAQKVRLLSGGEQQRVAVARMLAAEPQIVLADEPTGALDEDNAETVFRILQEVAKTRLVIAVTHDADSAARYADLLLHMTDGKLTVMRDSLSTQSGGQSAAFAGAADRQTNAASAGAASANTASGQADKAEEPAASASQPAASAGAADGQANAASAGAASAGGDAQASGRHGKTAKAAAKRRLPNKKQKSPSHFVQNLQMARAIASRSKLKSILYVLMLALLLTALLAAATVLYTDTANVTWHYMQDRGLQRICVCNTELNEEGKNVQLTDAMADHLNEHTNCYYYGYLMPGNLSNPSYGLTYAMETHGFRFAEGGPGETVVTDTYAQTANVTIGDELLVAHGTGMYGNKIEVYAAVSGIVDTSAMSFAEINMMPNVLTSLEYMETQGWRLMMNLFPQQAVISTGSLSRGELNHLLNSLHMEVTQMELTESGESADRISNACENSGFLQLKQLLLAACAILAVIIFAFTLYFIGEHIETNQRMLAILQVLGAKQKDFAAMFLLQFGCMLIIALLLAVCAMAFIFPLLPKLFLPQYADSGLQLFYINIYYLPALLCPLLTVPATLIPLRNIHRKAPVELLRR